MYVYVYKYFRINNQKYLLAQNEQHLIIIACAITQHFPSILKIVYCTNYCYPQLKPYLVMDHTNKSKKQMEDFMYAFTKRIDT